MAAVEAGGMTHTRLLSEHPGSAATRTSPASGSDRHRCGGPRFLDQDAVALAQLAAGAPQVVEAASTGRVYRKFDSGWTENQFLRQQAASPAGAEAATTSSRSNRCMASSAPCRTDSANPKRCWRQQVISARADLNARNPQFNARTPVPPVFSPVFSPVFASLFFASLFPTLCPNSVTVAGFDASLLANGPHTLLPTHSLRAGLLGD
jgi:hypothetical protein